MESVKLGEGLHCLVIGVEDLLIDRLNACKHWKSQVDCEMTELLIERYGKEMNWDYLERKAEQPQNDTLDELKSLKKKSL